MYYKITPVTNARTKDIRFKPELLIETILSRITRFFFSKSNPSYSWKRIGGFGLTSSENEKNVCSCESYEKAKILAKHYVDDNEEFIDISLSMRD